MTKEAILQKVCEKAGKNGTQITFWLEILQMASALGGTEEYMLRGFLLSPEVMKAVWGEEWSEKFYTCHRCGDRDLYSPKFADKKEFINFHKESEKNNKLYENHFWNGFDVDSSNITHYGWKEHAHQLVLLSTDEIIEYYGRFV